MTREEREQAIEQLEYAKALIEQDGKDYLDERDIPMLNMAIEALKAKPCGDTISSAIDRYNMFTSRLQAIREGEDDLT